MSSSNLYENPRPTVRSETMRSETMRSLAEKKDKYIDGEWIGVAALVGVTLVAALIIAVFTYYLITDDFSTTPSGDPPAPGKYSALGWVSTGGGLLMLFLTTLFATLIGGTLGLSFKSKTASLAAAVGSAVVVSLVLYWAFDAAHANRAFQVMLWAVLATVGGVVLAAWGWKMTKDLAAEEVNATTAARAQYSMYMLVAAIVVGLILLLGFWNIYSAVPVV